MSGPPDGFDVVVGAGCALAGRLTEDPSLRVLLLEVGGSDDVLEVRVPAALDGSINAVIYVRGAAADSGGWARPTGDPGWSYEQLLPLFRRMEDNSRGAAAGRRPTPTCARPSVGPT